MKGKARRKTLTLKIEGKAMKRARMILIKKMIKDKDTPHSQSDKRKI